MKRNAMLTAIVVGWLCAVCGAMAADSDYVENAGCTNQVFIVFDGASVTVSNAAGAGVSYTQNGAMITLTSAVEGVEYVLSGSATSGYVKLQGVCAAR